MKLSKDPTLFQLFTAVGSEPWAGKASAISAYTCLANAVTLLGEQTKLSALTAERLEDALALWRSPAPKGQGWSVAYAKNTLYALRMAVRWARGQGLLAYGPELPIPKIHPERAELRVLTRNEEARILRAVRDGAEDLAQLFQFILLTGLSVQEAIALRRSHLNGDELSIPGSRTVKLSKEALALLPEAERPFATCTLNRVTYAWNKALDELQVPMNKRQGLVPRCMRHTFGARLRARGASLEQLQEVMGYRSLSQVQRYRKYTKGSLET